MKITATYLSDHTYFSDEERDRLLCNRIRMYHVLYTIGLQETAKMFWDTWTMYYEQKIANSYRIVRS